MTIAQDWARERNFAKWRLKGLVVSCESLLYTKALLTEEKRKIDDAQTILRFVVSIWDKQNKQSKETYLQRERR